jgi:hypothetical protein
MRENPSLDHAAVRRAMADLVTHPIAAEPCEDEDGKQHARGHKENGPHPSHDYLMYGQWCAVPAFVKSVTTYLAFNFDRF